MINLRVFTKEKKKKRCDNCIFSKYLKANSIMASGYICYKNPFKPVGKGLFGKCGKTN